MGAFLYRPTPEGGFTVRDILSDELWQVTPEDIDLVSAFSTRGTLDAPLPTIVNPRLG
jgi:hypothetical protein